MIGYTVTLVPLPPIPDHIPAAGLGHRAGLWTAREAARALHRSEKHVYRLMAAGDLPYVTEGRRRLVRREDVDAYLAALPRTTSKAPVSGAAPVVRDFVIRRRRGVKKETIG
jgi:excisionase family DNA binding protein